MKIEINIDDDVCNILEAKYGSNYMNSYFPELCRVALKTIAGETAPQNGDDVIDMTYSWLQCIHRKPSWN